jgi:hypothetical protein
MSDADRSVSHVEDFEHDSESVHKLLGVVGMDCAREAMYGKNLLE